MDNKEKILAEVRTLVKRPKIYARVLQGDTIDISRPKGCFAAAEIYNNAELKVSAHDVFVVLNNLLKEKKLIVESSRGWILYRVIG